MMISVMSSLDEVPAQPRSPTRENQTYMQAQILTRSHCLATQQPCLGEAIDGRQKGGKQNERLDVSELSYCLSNIIEHH